MSFDQIFLLSLLAAVFVLFVWGRWRYDVVAFGAVVLTAVVGIVGIEADLEIGGVPVGELNDTDAEFAWQFSARLVLFVQSGLGRDGRLDLPRCG